MTAHIALYSRGECGVAWYVYVDAMILLVSVVLQVIRLWSVRHTLGADEGRTGYSTALFQI